MIRKATYSIVNSLMLGETDLTRYPLPEVNELDINLSQMHRNFQIIKDILKPEVKLLAILKGDAYAHGMLPIARELEELRCDAFGVVRSKAYTPIFKIRTMMIGGPDYR